MTELGVYILGAAALVILAWAGATAGDSTVMLCAVIASGAAYVSQFGVASTMAGAHAPLGPRASFIVNFVGLLVTLGAWAYGVWLLF